MPDKRRAPRVLTHDFPEGLSHVEFATYVYTGEHGGDSSPGLQIQMYIDRAHLDLLNDMVFGTGKTFADYRETMVDGKVMYQVGGGVMGRSALRQLRGVIDEFLADFPEEEQ